MQKQLAFFALFALLVCSAFGQQWTPTEQDLTFIPTPLKEGPAITPFLHELLEKAWAQDDRRAARIRAVKSESDLLRLQQELRASLLKNIGGLPETRTPLNPQILGTVKQPGYRVEKLVFESLPHYYVTALLWIPEGRSGRLPAVLVPCGHSTNGKILYQYICQRLVRRGYVALSWDPVGQGERSQFWDAAAGKTRYNLVCGEHAVLGNLAYLAGANLARWEIWDGMRALDYLLTRPEVDPDRISITGTSGGGFQAAHIAALDSRIKVAAPSCYISSLPMRMANRIFADPDSDPEQDIFRMVADGIDHSGLLLLIFPRPLILAAAVLDFFPIEGTRKTYHEIAQIYRYFGKGDSVSIVEGYHRHQYSPENLAIAFQFLDHYNRMPVKRELEPFDPLDEKLLVCTRSGQVSTEFPDAVPLTRLIRDVTREKKPGTASLADLYRSNHYPGIDHWKLAEFTGRPAEGSITWEAMGSVSGKGVTLSRYVLRHGKGLALPVIHVQPASPRSSRRAALLIRSKGKPGVKGWKAVTELSGQGFEVLLFDFRGVGEQKMFYSTKTPDDAAARRHEADYFNPLNSVMANCVYNSLLVGRPYFLQMIEDIEITARFAKEKLGLKDLTAVGETGEDATVAWAAGQCFPDLRVRAGRRFRWSETVERERELWPIQLLLPGGAYVD
ncbi:MAG: alpha/beta hydrolase family protein [Acidobacteriota bacterium]